MPRIVDPVLLGIAGYVLAQLLIGVWVSRRVRTEDDYLVAGRRLGPLLATSSIFATWFGAESCIGAAGQIHAEGLTRVSVEPFAYGLCLCVMGVVFAAPLWRRRITTIADLLRERFSPRVEHLAAVVLVPTSVLWAAAQIRAFGHVLSSASTLQVETSLAIAAGVAIVYTVLGGLLADVVTDLVQGIALVIGLVLLAVVVVGEHGGVGPALASIDPSRIRLLGDGPGPLATLEAWALPVCGSVLAQEIVSRAVASRSASVARYSAVGGGLIYLTVGLLPVGIALCGAGLVAAPDDPEQFLPDLARTHLPTVGYVVFAGALISAILSTVDSALLVAASFLSRNLILSGRKVSEATRVRTARLAVVALGLAAFLLARQADGVFELIEDASGFGSAGILVAVGFGLFTRFGGAGSALATLLAGLAVWIWTRYCLDEFPYPFLASLGAALAAYLAVAAWRGIRSAGTPVAG